jgi:hypothetical protein
MSLRLDVTDVVPLSSFSLIFRKNPLFYALQECETLWPFLGLSRTKLLAADHLQVGV